MSSFRPIGGWTLGKILKAWRIHWYDKLLPPDYYPGFKEDKPVVYDASGRCKLCGKPDHDEYKYTEL